MVFPFCRYQKKFDTFSREALHRALYPINVPADATVFDYCPDLKQGCLIRWCDKPQERMKHIPSHYNVISEVSHTHLYWPHPTLLVTPTFLGHTHLSKPHPPLLATPTFLGHTHLSQPHPPFLATPTFLCHIKRLSSSHILSYAQLSKPQLPQTVLSN